jgi:hypothetical protein
MVGIQVEKALGKVGQWVNDTRQVPCAEWVQALVAKTKSGQTLLELLSDGGLVPLRLPLVPALKAVSASSDNGDQTKVFSKQE